MGSCTCLYPTPGQYIASSDWQESYVTILQLWGVSSCVRSVGWLGRVNGMFSGFVLTIGRGSRVGRLALCSIRSFASFLLSNSSTSTFSTLSISCKISFGARLRLSLLILYSLSTRRRLDCRCLRSTLWMGGWSQLARIGLTWCCRIIACMRIVHLHLRLDLFYQLPWWRVL